MKTNTFTRRSLLGAALLSAAGLTMRRAVADVAGSEHVPAARERMYAAALAMVRTHIRGGDAEPYFRKPFVDAAFSRSIYLWDTCFMAVYSKYHQDELPIAQSLDNFYELQQADGFICREYTESGDAFWPEDHPVSSNPPLLAFAELELQSERPNLTRLRRVYPSLRAHYRYMVATYQMRDGLFFNDAFGSGMDNIPRYPPGWVDDGAGIPLRNRHPELFSYDGLSPKWNRQGRMVDISSQMALFAEQLAVIAHRVGAFDDARKYAADRAALVDAINRHCWHEEDGCYYDLAYGEPIRRRHIGMFWALWAGVAPPARQARLVRRLTDPLQFWRTIPVASTPADDPHFSPSGAYWLGSVWAPTNYMVIRGLQRTGRGALAARLARQYYERIEAVYAATGTFWENYAPDAVTPGSPSRADFCGWTAIAPIALYREFLLPARHRATWRR